jgi:hypothetical protein
MAEAGSAEIAAWIAEAALAGAMETAVVAGLCDRVGGFADAVVSARSRNRPRARF